MSSKAAKTLLIASLPVLAFGAYLVRYATGLFYDEIVAISGAGIVAAGLAIAGIGLGKLTKPVVGIVIFLAGTGYVVMRWRTAASHDDDQRRALALREQLAQKLAPVCAGHGEPGAAPLADTGRRPAVVLGIDANFTREEALDDTWHPDSLATAQLVVCDRTTEESLEACTYEGGGQHAYLKRGRYHESIEIREARTGKLLAEHTFVGGDPPKDCPDHVQAKPGLLDFMGPMPSDAETKQFIRGYVER